MMVFQDLSELLIPMIGLFFDSPELFHVQDEGTVLRKLLAVFSFRPTFTQLSSYTNRYGLGYTTISGLSKTVYVNIPIVNIKLPMDPAGGHKYHAIPLRQALTQTDYFIEHKIVVPKNKSVIYSNKVAFFYANRRFPSVNFNALSMNMRCVSLPVSFVNQTTINHTVISFEPGFRIGRDWFYLRSVVILQRPPINGVDIAIGCSALIVSDQNVSSNLYQGTGTTYLHYNPSIASLLQYVNEEQKEYLHYRANSPITYIEEVSASNDNRTIGFRQEAQERGTIFFYVKPGDRFPCEC